MKRIFLICVFYCCSSALSGQIVKPKDVAKDAGTNTVNGDIRSGINNAADKANNELKGLFKKKKKQEEPVPQAAAPQAPQAANAQAPAANTAEQVKGSGTFKAYSNYDFVPGDKIVFEDNFVDDQDGEFPAHWNLGRGQAVLNKLGDREALLITDGNFAHVSPVIKGAGYLTDTFTIEFDSYTNGGYGPHIFFYDNNNDARQAEHTVAQVNICAGNGWNGVNVVTTDNKTDLTGNYPSEIGGDNYQNKWHHVAIVYRHKQIKVYVDQFRVLTVPGIDIAPKAIDIEGIGSIQNPVVISNFRIANGGGMNMWNKKVTDAKIVTHGINFDIDKATLKPESMGTLNMISKILNDNPDIKYEIDGHTDNSGGMSHNLLLSQQRAEAVKQQLTVMGIDANRLYAKGFGDTKPINENVTIEGRANNRRVEFVKK